MWTSIIPNCWFSPHFWRWNPSVCWVNPNIEWFWRLKSQMLTLSKGVGRDYTYIYIYIYINNGSRVIPYHEHTSPSPPPGSSLNFTAPGSFTIFSHCGPGKNHPKYEMFQLKIDQPFVDETMVFPHSNEKATRLDRERLNYPQNDGWPSLTFIPIYWPQKESNKKWNGFVGIYFSIWGLLYSPN